MVEQVRAGARMREPAPHGALAADWEAAKSRFPVGSVVTGTVSKVVPFGFFVDLGLISVQGLLLLVDFDGAGSPVCVDELPVEGETIEAVVLDLPDWKRQLVLSRRVEHYPD
jgi:small subunit ribosomal protein S1